MQPRTDFIIDEEFGGIVRNKPVDWYDGFKANVAYYNMPMIESMEENRLYGSLPKDENFNIKENILKLPEIYSTYTSDFLRARNKEHFDYIKDRLDLSTERRRVAGEAPFTAQIVGGLLDKTSIALLIPGFNYIKASRSLATGFGRGAYAGLGYGIASEAGRAPYEVGVTESEIYTNVGMPTLLGGMFGTLGSALRSRAYKKRLRSTQFKLTKLAQGNKISSGLDNGKGKVKKNRTGQDWDSFDWEVQGNLFGSPSQRIMSNKNIPNFVKSVVGRIAYNGSVAFTGLGNIPRGFQSVDTQMAGFRSGYQTLMTDLKTIWQQRLDARMPTDDTSTFDEWFAKTVDRYIVVNSKRTNKNTGEVIEDSTWLKNLVDDDDKNAFLKLEKFFKQYSDDLKFYGVVKPPKKILQEIQERTVRLEKAEADLKSLKSFKFLNASQRSRLKTLPIIIKRLKQQIKIRNQWKKSPLHRDFIFPIYYDKIKLSDPKVQEEFLTMAEAHYLNERQLYPEHNWSNSAREDAERTLARILQEDGEEIVEQFGLEMMNMRTSKHLQHRKTNFSEGQVRDFIIKDKEVIYNYVERMGQKIAFAKNFGGKTIKDVLDDVAESLEQANFKDDDIVAIQKDILADFDRVMGNARRDPTRLDNQAAKALKAFTSWAYLGKAGISAISDVGSIIMAHGSKRVFDGIKAAASDSGYRNFVVKELTNMHELVDMTMGAIRRAVLDDKVSRMNETITEKVIQKGNKAFYTLNLLGPVTLAGKFLNGMLATDKFIRLSNQWKKGTISQVDKEFLMRHGYDLDLAKYVADQPVVQHENGKFFMGNTDAWKQNTILQRERLRRFRSAISMHNSNTIIWGQTFDKPLFVDGIVYFKDNVFFQKMRQTFPNSFKIDKRIGRKGINYVRVDSGAMTLPFAFMNYAFGANNKILNRVIGQQEAYRVQGVIALLSLSALSLHWKSGYFVKMDTEDQLARIVDHSGLMGIYTDIGYMGAEMLHGMNIIDGDKSLIRPRYIPPEDEKFIDGIIAPAGAPTGLLTEYVRAIGDFLDGNTSDGAERVAKNAPFFGLPYIKDDVLAMTRGLTRY